MSSSTADTAGQASGILMAQTGCTEREAFEHLRSASQRENVKVREVAARLVEGARSHARRRRRHT